MAYVDSNELTPSLPQIGQPNQLAPVSSGGTGLGGATKQSASTPGQNIPAQPSAQLSAYLNANQPQATQFAGNIATQAGQQTQAAANAIQPAVNTYTGQLYTAPNDPALNAQVASSPSSLTPAQQQEYKQEISASSQPPNAANTFETSAPYQSIAQNVQNAVEQQNLWNSGNNPANLSTALHPYESPNATSGDTTLDALLLSQSPGAYSQIQQAVSPASQLQSQLTAGTNQADKALQNAIATDTAATPAAQAAAQTYANNLTQYLNNQVTQAQAAGNTNNAQILKDVQSGNLSPADLSALGITAAQYQTLQNELSAPLTQPIVVPPIAIPGWPSEQGATQVFGTLPNAISLTQYLNQTNPSTINAANEATAQNYADVAALQSLLGGNAPILPITSTTANEAGTAPQNLSSFNITQALQDALAYQQAVNAAGYQDAYQAASAPTPSGPVTVNAGPIRAFSGGGEVYKNLSQYLEAL
jgi:hypothetical protein